MESYFITVSANSAQFRESKPVKHIGDNILNGINEGQKICERLKISISSDEDFGLLELQFEYNTKPTSEQLVNIGIMANRYIDFITIRNVSVAEKKVQ